MVEGVCYINVNNGETNESKLEKVMMVTREAMDTLRE